MTQSSYTNYKLILAEKKTLLKKQFAVSYINSTLFSFYELWNGLFTVFYTITFYVTLTNIIIFLLYKKNKLLEVKYLFIISLNFFVFYSSYLLKFNDLRSVILFPIGTVSFFIFDSKEKKSKIFAAILPVITFGAIMSLELSELKTISTMLSLNEMRAVNFAVAYIGIILLFGNYSKYLKRIKELSVSHSNYIALDNMASGIAHEINNPLAIIKGKTLQIKRNNKASPTVDFSSDTDVILKSVERINQMVKSLKTFSSSSTKSGTKYFEVCDLVRVAIDICKEKLVLNGIKIDIDCKNSFKIKGEETEFIQSLCVLINMIFSDLTQSPDNRWIKIEVNSNEIRISDSYSIMNPSRETNNILVFLKNFLELSDASTELNTVKEIVKSHKGIFSTDCDSARFTMQFPYGNLL